MPATVNTVAHEIGHYTKEEPFDRPDGPEGPGTYPLAQRDSDAANPRTTGGGSVGGGSYDLDHARHRNSDVDEDGDTDGPGIVSRGYDLTGGTFRTVNGYGFDGTDFVPGLPLDVNPAEDDFPTNSDKNKQESDGTYDPNDQKNAPGYDEVLGTRRHPSYMSYQDPAWADSRMHEVVIDSGYRRDKWDGSGPIFDATGAVDDDGGVQLVSVDAYQGRPLVDSWDGDEAEMDSARPVEVSLETPNGEVVASRTVSDKRLANRHIQTVVETVDLLVEFPMDTATVSLQREGVQTEINPITSVLRDVIERVPDEGFAAEPEQVRSEATSTIDAVAEEMADQQFEDAKSTLQDEFMPIAQRAVRAEYDAVTGEPTSEVVVDYTERMIARLEALAAAADQGDEQEEDSEDDEPESYDCGSLTASYDRFDASGTGVIADFDYPAATDQVNVRSAGDARTVRTIAILDNDRTVVATYIQRTGEPLLFDPASDEQVTTVEFGGTSHPVYLDFDNDKARGLAVPLTYDGQEFVVRVAVGIDQEDPSADIPAVCKEAAIATARDMMESLEPNPDATL